MWTRGGLAWAVVAFWCLSASVAVWDDTVAPLQVVEPAGVNGTFDYHMAHFGSIPYGRKYDNVRLVVFPTSCMCGHAPSQWPCNTGCGTYDATTPDCRPKVNTVQVGTEAQPEITMFVLYETGKERNCDRAQRAVNVAKAGGDSVLIIAPQGASDLVPAVDMYNERAQQTALQLQHVDIPVGMIRHADGSAIIGAAKATKLSVDFSNVFTPRQKTVQITVWHNTGDDCGPPCFYLHLFMRHLADAAQFMPKGYPIQIVPRFTYTSATRAGCNNPKSAKCKKECANGRYCHEKLENDHLWGKLIAQENIRQSCLWQTLRDNGDTRKFWIYKQYFQKNCQNNKKSFNVQCSEQAWKAIGEGNPLYANWKKCWQGIGRGTDPIRIADNDIADMNTQKVRDGLLATVIIGTQHYRGELDAAHVFKAACSALDPQVAKDLKICKEFTQGKCAPGTTGDRICSNQNHQAVNRNICIQKPENERGFRCACKAGYAETWDDDGVASCIDRNECLEFPTLCNRNPNTRNACQNLEAAFRCLYNIEDECSAQNDFNGCWRDTINGVQVHSCQDLFPLYAYNLQNGRQGGDLSVCNCENIRGCWDGDDGVCTPRCLGDCNPATKTCEAGRKGLRTGAAAGIGVAAVLVLLLAIGGFLFWRYRGRAGKPDPAISQPVVTDYVNFRDGMDGDEMGRTGTGGQSGSPGRNAVGASLYAMRAGKQESAVDPEAASGNAFDAALDVREHPES